MEALLATARTFTTLAFLLYASWKDYKTREVSNKVWAFLAPIAFALTLIGLVSYTPPLLLGYGICVAIVVGFSILLFYSGGFGGADAKALMCLAFALPFYPTELLYPCLGEVSPISSFVFPMTIFSNAVLFAALTAIIILFYNIGWRIKTGRELFEGGQKKESTGKRILVLMTGYKTPIDRLEEKWHIYPLEDIEETAQGTTRRKLVILPKDEGKNEVVQRLNNLVKTGKIQNRVWATPGLPMLVFITAGLITALLFGDIIWTLIRFLVR